MACLAQSANAIANGAGAASSAALRASRGEWVSEPEKTSWIASSASDARAAPSLTLSSSGEDRSGKETWITGVFASGAIKASGTQTP